MPLTDEQRDSLKADEGSNVFYVKPDRAIYYSSKRINFRDSHVRNDMAELSAAVKQYKADHPNQPVNVVRV